MKKIMFSMIATALMLFACKISAQEKEAAPPMVSGQKSLTAPANSEPLISKEFHDEIVQLLKLIGAESLSNQYGDTFNRMMIGELRSKDDKFSEKEVNFVKEETKKFMDEKFPELLERLVPVYAKHFTRDEVKELITFYKSPVGIKAIKELPLISRESMMTGNAWGKSVMRDVDQRVRARLEKEGYKSPTPEGKAPAPAPAPTQDKK